MALIKFQGGWDIHGIHANKGANKAFFAFRDFWKPAIRICGGDLWNFACLRAGAKEDEKRQSLRDDFDAGTEWFNNFKPTIATWGNHDKRLWDTAQKATGIAQDYAWKMIGEVEQMVKSHRCETVAYNKRLVYKLGDTAIVHGFASGVGGCRKMAMVYKNCLYGHNHTIEQCPAPGLSEQIARCVGCLCELDQDYNATQIETLRQAHGFAYGFLNSKTGTVTTFQARKIDGKWMFPSEFFNL